MDLLVRIRNGQIVVEQPAVREVEPFQDERAALAYIAYHVVQKVKRLVLDVSCDRPAAHGRPTFNKNGFQALLSREITTLRGSVSSLA